MDSTSLTSELEVDSGVESTNSADGVLYIRVSVPELNIQKCLQFHQEDSVWTGKQQILSTIAKDVRDGLNYGLYCPPINGKAGKFLDEERCFKDYPLTAPIGFLEFKYKRRVYKRMQMNPKKLKQLHTKANLKQTMESIRKGDLVKVTKFINKGLDPNFIDAELGEAPLTLAVGVGQDGEVARLIMTLVGGGAHLDLRNRRGMTPMHVAAQRDKAEAIRTLLDLGASPNSRDDHGLTPLYLAVCAGASSRVTEMLLYDHALVGVTDDSGLTELHQACKFGRVQHVEQLVYYGAEMNAQNAGGNTALHSCAVNNQVECARVLLFRGIDKNIKNYANQNASEVAVISGNLDLAQMMRDFSAHEAVPHQEMPKYNDKRRSKIPQATLSTLQRSRSNPHLSQLFCADDDGSPRRRAADSRRADWRAEGLYDMRLPAAYRASVTGLDELDHSGSQRSISISSSESFQGVDMGNTLINASAASYDVPRSVVLHQGREGFGFILRGAKVLAENSLVLLDFVPTPEMPGLQFFDHVDPNSVADKAGIKPGDFLLEINSRNVRTASHDLAVQLIQGSGDRLVLVVVTPRGQGSKGQGSSLNDAAYANTLPRRGRHAVPDNTLADYEFSPDSYVLDSATLNKMAAARGVDPTNKVASIRSVHGKRLTSTPDASQLFNMDTISDTLARRQAFCGEPGKLWRPRSTQQLASDGARHSVFVPPAPPLPPPVKAGQDFGETEDRTGTVIRQASEPTKPWQKTTSQSSREGPSHFSSNYHAAVNTTSSVYDSWVGNSENTSDRNANSFGVSENFTNTKSSGRRWSELPSPVSHDPPLAPTNKPRPPVPSRKPALPVQMYRQGSDEADRDCRAAARRASSSDVAHWALTGAPLSLAGPHGPLAGPHSPLAGPHDPLAGPHGPPVAGPQGLRAGPHGPLAATHAPPAGPRSPQAAGPLSPIPGSPDFLAQAERARVAFVAKKAAGKPANSAGAGAGGGAAAGSAAAGRGSLNLQEDLAQTLARRAAARQCVSEQCNNVASRDERSVVVRGITVDHSHTDPVLSSDVDGDYSRNVTERNPGLRAIGRDYSVPNIRMGSSGVVPPPPPPPPPLDHRTQGGALKSGRVDSGLKIPVKRTPIKSVQSEEQQGFRDAAMKRGMWAKYATPTKRDTAAPNFKFGGSTPTLVDEDQFEAIVLPAPPGFDDDEPINLIGQRFVDPPRKSSLAGNSRSYDHSQPFVTSYVATDTRTFDNAVVTPGMSAHDRPMVMWSVADVSDWLTGLRMDEHVGAFARGGVDGRRLAACARTELIELGITQVGQRMSIERAIKKVLMTQEH